MARIDIINSNGDPQPTNPPDIEHPVNVLAVNRILTKANPAGMPSVDPTPLTGMMDVAAKKPQEQATLTNEHGEPEVCVVDYTTDVVRGGDLIDNTRPERIAGILRPLEPSRPYEMGVVSRISHQMATYNALILDQTELSDESDAWCAAEETRVLALLDAIDEMQQQIARDRVSNSASSPNEEVI